MEKRKALALLFLVALLGGFCTASAFSPTSAYQPTFIIYFFLFFSEVLILFIYLFLNSPRSLWKLGVAGVVRGFLSEIFYALWRRLWSLAPPTRGGKRRQHPLVLFIFLLNNLLLSVTM
jgi:hypothetical protein